MASLDLHGARTDNSLRAAIALAESGLAFRAVPVNLHAGDHRKPAFVRLNSLGKVPVLVIDDGDGPRVLTQSAAIMLEAARRAGERLLPAEPRARALATERLLYFLTDVIAPSHAGFYLSRIGYAGATEAMEALVVERMGAGEAFLRHPMDGRCPLLARRHCGVYPRLVHERSHRLAATCRKAGPLRY